MFPREDLIKTLATAALALLGTARLPAQNQVSVTVDVTMDIYRAGGDNDGSDGIAPVIQLLKSFMRTRCSMASDLTRTLTSVNASPIASTQLSWRIAANAKPMAS